MNLDTRKCIQLKISSIKSSIANVYLLIFQHSLHLTIIIIIVSELTKISNKFNCFVQKEPKTHNFPTIV